MVQSVEQGGTWKGESKVSKRTRAGYIYLTSMIDETSYTMSLSYNMDRLEGGVVSLALFRGRHGSDIIYVHLPVAGADNLSVVDAGVFLMFFVFFLPREPSELDEDQKAGFCKSADSTWQLCSRHEKYGHRLCPTRAHKIFRVH